MKNRQCFPTPKPPNFSFVNNDSFIPLSNNPFEFEVYWDIERTSSVTKQYFLSQLLPLYLKMTPLDMVRDFIDYFISGNQDKKKHIIICREKTSHEVEGFTFMLELQDFHFLPNNTTKENAFSVISGITVVSSQNRKKGL